MTTLQNLDDALARVAERQRTARVRAWLAVLVPAAVGAAFLIYATSELTTATKQVDRLQAEAGRYEERVATLTKEVESRTQEIAGLQTRLQVLESQLKQTTDLARFTHPMDLIDLKTIYSRAPQHIAPVLGTILELRERNIGWSLGGTDPGRGFDSPSFAAFVLREHGALPADDGAAGNDLLQRSRQLFDSLPAAEEPQVGDLVFYPAGYALFWFVDRNNRPFVIGMTPTGIVALEPNFAARAGVRRPKYR